MPTLSDLARDAYGQDVSKAWRDPVKRAERAARRATRRKQREQYGWLGAKTYRASQGSADAWADQAEERLTPAAWKVGAALGTGIGGGIAAGGTLSALARRKIVGRNEPTSSDHRR